MILYIYHYDCKTKTVEESTIEVVEKPKTYKAKDGNFPFRYVSIIGKEEVDGDKINTRDLTYISQFPNSTETAVRMFRKYWGEKWDNAKANAALYEDYYGSCFAYHKDGKGVMVP